MTRTDSGRTCTIEERRQLDDSRREAPCIRGSGFLVALVTMLVTMLVPGGPAVASAQVADSAQFTDSVLTLSRERMIEMSLSTGYEIQFLDMSVDQTQARLRAERARLRSSVQLDLSAPDLQSVSETQYNAVLGRNEVVRENSRRWEAELSIRQPVILFGYPTNGYLSLNNQVYRYLQIAADDERDLTYYNRYFVRYTQPLFQPNSLKNSLEEAELDLEDAEIGYYDDMVELITDASEEYWELFETVYTEGLLQAHVGRLEEASVRAERLIAADSSRSGDLDQIRVEVANVREEAQRTASDFRRQVSGLRTQLSIPESVQLRIDPVMAFQPVDVPTEEAIALALDLTPQLRQLEIGRRENEIRLEETAGRNAFRVDLEFTYGREMRDPVFDRLMSDPTNSYTIDVNAYLPIWDWGERSARIESSRINVQRDELRIEQTRSRIRSEVENEIQNVRELQDRVLTMRENLDLAEGLSDTALNRYEAEEIGVLDLLQTLRRELDTSRNYLDAYLGWRDSLLGVQDLTFFDFESGMTVLDRYGISL